MDAPAKRILLIEDNPDDACLLREALIGFGEPSIELVHVEKLDSGLQHLRSDSFDVILLDLSLPDSQGVDTLLRVQVQSPAAPVVVLTGLADDETAVKALRFGAQDYLVKGEIDARMLSRSIRYASERKQAFEKMANLAADLTRANKVKDEFLGVMSHELRTPLITIMGYARLLEGDLSQGPTSHGKAARVIREKSDELLGMIRSILEVVEIESGDVRLVTRTVNLREFITELSKEYSDIKIGNIALEWEQPASLPNIITDPGKLRQILRHLIANAIKFTQRGQVTISVRQVPEMATVEFAVRDTGIGISPEILPGIFEKFRQADSSDTRQHDGMGLGLYLVKKFTELLKARIAVQSQVGIGSVFTLTLGHRPSPDEHGIGWTVSAL
jgi:signal transduction histidine kinase